MALENKETQYKEISEMPHWKLLKSLMVKDLDSICDIEKMKTYEELCGAQMCKKWASNIIKKIDGAKDSLTFNK